MDDIDRQLLTHLKQGLPFVPHPFEAIGRSLDLDEPEVLLRISKYRDQRICGQIRTTVSGRPLGFQSAVVGFKVPSRGWEFISGLVNQHPGVINSFACSFEINFWFTLSLASQEDLFNHSRWLQKALGIEKIVFLVNEKIYKAKDHEGVLGVAPGGMVSKVVKLSGAEIKVLQSLNQDLAIIDRPFGILAQRAGLNEEDYLKELSSLRKRHLISDFRAVPAGEHESTFRFVHWFGDVPEERVDRVLKQICKDTKVSFCAKCGRWEDYPYSVHVVTELDGKKSSANLEPLGLDPSGVWKWKAMVMNKRLKKGRFHFPSPDLEKWNSFQNIQRMAETTRISQHRLEEVR